MAKPNFTLPNKPAIKSGGILSYNYTDDFTFVPAPLTFNRDSAATRVNEKGLIEDVGYFGPELVQNGDFSEIGPELVTNGDFATDSDWVISGLNLSISNGKGISTGSNFGAQFKQTILQTNKTYKLTFDIVDYTSGAIGVTANYYGEQNVFSSIGTHTTIFTSLNQTEFRLYSQDFVGSVTNVSVKEVGQNWTFGTGWGIAEINGNQVAEFDGGADAAIQQVSILTSGKKYRLSIDVANKTTGSLQIRFGNTGVVDETITTNGTFTYDLVSDGSTLYLRSISGFDGYIDNVSVIEVLGDKPRIDYSDSLTEPSLLLEPQSTNLVTFSEDFSQSNWIKGRTEVLLNTAISPDGNFNASTLSVINATGGEEFLRIISGGSNPATCSIYVKKGNWRYITIRSVNISVFDFDTETFTLTGANETLSFEKLKNGWYRLKASSPTRTYCSVGFAANATATSGSGVNGSYMYIWGAQLEELPYATSYIPTAGSTATRLGETANNAGDVNVFNGKEGVLYAEINPIAVKTESGYLALLGTDTSNRIILGFPANSNDITYFVISQGVLLAQSSYDIGDMNKYIKVALKYSEDNFAVWLNGSKILTDTSGVPNVQITHFGFYGYITNQPFYGKVKNVKAFNKALTDRELEILTIQ